MSHKLRNVPPIDTPEPGDHPDPQLQALLDKIPEAYTVTIRKMVQGKWRFQRTVQPDAIGPVLEDFIQRNFGGGTFQVLLNESNGRCITSRGGIEIEELPENERPKPDAIAEEQTPAAAGAIVKRNGGTFSDMIEMMREENNRMHALMLEMIRAGSDRGGGGQSVTELVTALAQLKRLEPPPPPAPASMDEIFLKGVEFARKANGAAAGTSDDGFMGIVREVIDLAKPMIQKMATPGAAAPAVVDPAAPAAAVVEEGEEMQVDIGEALTYLKFKFRQGTSIPVLAEMITDQMQGNEDFTAMVLHVANLPAAEFLALDDEFAAEPFRQAATNLHAELRRRLIPAEVK